MSLYDNISVTASEVFISILWREGKEAEIQLPLKRFPDSSVSSLILVELVWKGIPPPKTLQLSPDSCLMVTKPDFLEMEASL